MLPCCLCLARACGPPGCITLLCLCFFYNCCIAGKQQQQHPGSHFVDRIDRIHDCTCRRGLLAHLFDCVIVYSWCTSTDLIQKSTHAPGPLPPSCPRRSRALPMCPAASELTCNSSQPPSPLRAGFGFTCVLLFTFVLFFVLIDCFILYCTATGSRGVRRAKEEGPGEAAETVAGGTAVLPHPHRGRPHVMQGGQRDAKSFVLLAVCCFELRVALFSVLRADDGCLSAQTAIYI